MSCLSPGQSACAVAGGRYPATDQASLGFGISRLQLDETLPGQDNEFVPRWPPSTLSFQGPHLSIRPHVSRASPSALPRPSAPTAHERPADLRRPTGSGPASLEAGVVVLVPVLVRGTRM